MRRRLATLAAVLVAAAIGGGWLFQPVGALAHPLGNFTVSTHSGIKLYADAVRVHYVVDMAEIPTFQEKGKIDTDGDGVVSAAEADVYLDSRTPELVGGLELTYDGDRVALTVLQGAAVLLPGQGGLETLRVDLLLSAPAPSGAEVVRFEDTNYDDRLGWREVVVRGGSGVPVLTSNVAAESVTAALTAYPADRAEPSLRVTSAEFSYVAGAGERAPAAELREAQANVQASAGFAGLVEGRDLTIPVVLLLLVVAMGFGAVHALEPGHGKTIVAAYFVGASGRAGHAALLGLIVAVTHSLGVLVIGAVTLYGTRYVLPEQLYPWLTLVSGLMVIGLGMTLLASRLRGSGAFKQIATGHFLRHRHAHAEHAEHDHDHDHEGGHSHAHAATSGPPWKSLVVLGLIDGLVPTPSTLVVLLSAISVGAFGLGLALIVAFSVGLAVVLSSISLVTIVLRGLFARVARARAGADSRSGQVAGRLAATLPALAAVVLIGSGAIVVARASASTFLG